MPEDARCAVVGIGETAVGKLPGSTPLSLNLEASVRAVEDAGLTLRDIDGVLTQQPYTDPIFMFSAWVADHLGIKPRFTTDLNIGGATPCAMVIHASLAVRAGLCSTVLCTFGDNVRTAPETRRHGRYRMGVEDFAAPFGAGAPVVAYALAARRHMHLYGTESRQLGCVAVAMRRHACLNPNAQMREPITLEDHQKSRFIAEPLRLLDCCLISDGGGAVVVTSLERARDLPRRPIRILGMGEFHTHRHVTSHEDLTEIGAGHSAKQAFGTAGLTPKDVDVAEIYDCFTSTVVMQLEAYGFCRKGEGGGFVEGGRIELGGELPVNTHGGLLSQAHIDGMLHVVEGVRQLRGEAGDRQVPGAEVALVTGNGGPACATHATLILGV